MLTNDFVPGERETLSCRRRPHHCLTAPAPHSLVCLLVLLCGLTHAAPAPLPRRGRPAPATEVVVTLLNGNDPSQRVEITLGPRRYVVQRTQTWDQDLNARLRQLRTAPRTPDKLTAICDVAEISPTTYIRFVRACRTAGFTRIQLKSNGKKP